MASIFTASQTVTIYKQMDNTKASFPIRMKQGDTGNILADFGAWLQVDAKSVVGYVERKHGIVSGSTLPPIPNPSDVWGIINLDYDQHWDADFKFAYHVSRPKRNDPNISVSKGLPAVGRFTLDTRVRFTKDLQLWIHGLCSERIPSATEAYKKSSFASLWRSAAFMTNDGGTDRYADHINGTKLSKEDPKLQPMGCAGTLLKIVGETTKDYIIEAINPLRGYRQYHPAIHRHLFFEPNNSRREWSLFTGWDESICIPFGQYNNRAIVPIFGNGNTNRNQIQKWRVRILFPGEGVPSPYNTSGGFTYPNPYEGMTG